LQPGLQAQLHASAWPLPTLFDWLQREGDIELSEMHRVFNCGIGMVLVVDAVQAEAISTALSAADQTVYTLGQIAVCDAQAAPTVVL
jgi:phosphoribosylformylglycinamidine cyclo-ligase